MNILNRRYDFCADIIFDGKESLRGLQCLLSSEKLNLIVDTSHG